MLYRVFALMSGADYQTVFSLLGSRFLQNYVAGTCECKTSVYLVTCGRFKGILSLYCVQYANDLVTLSSCSELALSILRLVTQLVCSVGIPVLVTHCVLKYVAPCYRKPYFNFIVCVKQTDMK